nr:hypothetical protein [Streptomyces odonnellii]
MAVHLVGADSFAERHVRDDPVDGVLRQRQRFRPGLGQQMRCVHRSQVQTGHFQCLERAVGAQEPGAPADGGDLGQQRPGTAERVVHRVVRLGLGELDEQAADHRVDRCRDAMRFRVAPRAMHGPDVGQQETAVLGDIDVPGFWIVLPAEFCADRLHERPTALDAIHPIGGRTGQRADGSAFRRLFEFRQSVGEAVDPGMLRFIEDDRKRREHS